MIDLFRDSTPRWICIVLRSLPLLIGSAFAAVFFATKGVSTASVLGFILYVVSYVTFWFIFDICIHAEGNGIINLQYSINIVQPTEGPKKVIGSEPIHERKLGSFVQREYEVYDIDPDDLIDGRYATSANLTEYTILITEATDVNHTIDNIKILMGTLCKDVQKKQYTVDVDLNLLPDDQYMYALDAKTKDTKIKALEMSYIENSKQIDIVRDEFQNKLIKVAAGVADALEITNDTTGRGSGTSKEMKEKQISSKSGGLDAKLRTDMLDEIDKLKKEYDKKMKELEQ